MKGYIVRIPPYATHLLLNFIDNGANRPLDEIRRLRRLTQYMIEQQGDYAVEFDDIVFKSRSAREAIPVTPQDQWRHAMSHINALENEALAVLNTKYADTLALTLSDADLQAVKKWWRDIASFPSQGVVADAVLAIDDALKSPEEIEIEGGESQRPALPHISELRRKKR